MIAAIVALDRPRALGEQHRIAAWERYAELAGFSPVRVALRSHHATGPAPARWPDPLAVLRGAAPETLGWSPRSLRPVLDDLEPDAIVVITARAFHPCLLEHGATVIVDYVDALGNSYAQRAAGRRDLRALGFRVLARTMARAERTVRQAGVATAAAGRGDAELLDATWLPSPVATGDVPPARPGPFSADLLFFGNLSYAPNLAAIARLEAVWPAVARRRPDTRLRLAGRFPTDAVRDAVARHGWDLWEDFPSVPELCADAAVAVAPIPASSGIQNKVLEAAAEAVPQVITPAVAAGLSEDFPARTAEGDAALVEAIVDLLDDPTGARALGEASWRHVHERFAAEAWLPTATALLAPAT